MPGRQFKVGPKVWWFGCCFFLLLHRVCGVSRVVFLADTHVGEGCNSSYSGYELNDTNCYSVRDLKATVAKINELHLKDDAVPFSLVLLGGDVTSSAQPTEFVAARKELDTLLAPYLSIMGNHDVWSYNEVVGDLTPTPVADRLFAETFRSSFEKFHGPFFTYGNKTVYNPAHQCNSTFQSWSLEGGSSAIQNNNDLANVKFIAPDFNTRVKAPPPCPGHSPIGGCGVPGMAELFNFTKGTLKWFEQEVVGNIRRTVETVIFMIHQPFRCRFGVPDWAFCFSKDDKKAIRDIIRRSTTPLDKFWGVLAGHQHRWFNGTAFDEPDFQHFRQWENSAVKGDVFDSKMASSFTILTFEDSKVVHMEKFWTENGVWKQQGGE
jgi:hypothetical protein